jgi:PAS domain S-box-containing protein
VKDYAIFVLDPTGRVSTWNRGAERIKGYKADEIIGKHFSVFYPPEEALAGKCDRELEVAVSEGRFEEEGWRVRKDGSRMWANVTITPLYSPDGVLVGFAKVTRDLTERRQAEEIQRALAAERATLAATTQVQEFQERFLAILGHDLRNPLASIDMGAGILRQRATDPTMLRVIDRMRASSLRMSRMIEQILDLTRSRLAGGLPMRPQPVDLRDIVSRIVDEMRAAYPSREIVPACPSAVGNWDADRLEQVFSNLIGNAILHGDGARPVTITVRVDDDTVRVDVHSDGPPIPEDLQRVLFDPFRRGQRDSRTSKTSGLGLGLYISKEIVRAHGGALDVRSVTEEGTDFRVTLPRQSWTSAKKDDR